MKYKVTIVNNSAVVEADSEEAARENFDLYNNLELYVEPVDELEEFKDRLYRDHELTFAQFEALFNEYKKVAKW